MAVIGSLLSVAGVWLTVHAIARLSGHGQASRAATKRHDDDVLLPVSRAPASSSRWSASLGICWATVSTTSLNAWPAALASKAAWRPFYRYADLLVSLLQPIAVLALFVYSFRQLVDLWSVLSNGGTTDVSMAWHRWRKRAVIPSHPNANALRPLLPGLTLPWSEAPLLLLGLFVSAAVHEAGHAICAAVEGMTPTSMGAFVAVVFPGAFVSLPSGPLDLLPVTRRRRIWTAGIAHNLVLALICLALGQQGLSALTKVEACTFWRDRSDTGVVVQSVAPAFVLSSYLRPGTLITHLDDVELHDSDERDHWANFLRTEDLDPYASLGWCVVSDVVRGAPTDCCETADDKSTSNLTQPLCFTTGDSVTRYCLPARAILSANPPLARCVDACTTIDHLCLRPSPDLHLLRLTIQPVESPVPLHILYRGPRHALLAHVHVGALQPRFSTLVPAALPYHFDRFLAHTLSATLGLALFNLLPFPRLDGAAILACLLDGDDGPARLAPFRRWRRTIEGATVGMMAWAMLGAFTGAAVA